jgi:striatin 1/3/4
MAWQSPAMSGMGMPGQMGDGSNGGHPQGTEYTLQGEHLSLFFTWAYRQQSNNHI